MTPHIHIEDARAAIDAVNNELTTWINRTRDAEHEAHLLEDRLQTLGYEHQQLEQEFVDLAANSQWLADIIRSHLPHLPEAREALDASPGVSTARFKAEVLTSAATAMRAVRESIWNTAGWDQAIDYLEHCARRYLEKTQGGDS